MAEAIQIRIQALDEASKVLNDVKKSMKKLTVGAKEASDALKKSTKDTDEFSKGLKSLQGQLLGAGLSSLFFGMALQRLFGRITRDSVAAFEKISEGSNAGAQALASLRAGFMFLRYTIGDAIATALRPFLTYIIDIIEWVSEWIQQHKMLTAAILLGGLALATLLVVLGTVGSALNGFISLLELLGLKMLLKAPISSLMSGLNSLIAGAFTPLGIAILILIGFVSLLFWTFNQYPETSKKVLSGAFEPLKESVIDLANKFASLFEVFGINVTALELLGATALWFASEAQFILTVFIDLTTAVLTLVKSIFLLSDSWRSLWFGDTKNAKKRLGDFKNEMLSLSHVLDNSAKSFNNLPTITGILGDMRLEKATVAVNQGTATEEQRALVESSKATDELQTSMFLLGQTTQLTTETTNLFSSLMSENVQPALMSTQDVLSGDKGVNPAFELLNSITEGLGVDTLPALNESIGTNVTKLNSQRDAANGAAAAYERLARAMYAALGGGSTSSKSKSSTSSASSSSGKSGTMSPLRGTISL